MKLLIFIYSLSSGGAERVTANLANYWAEKGWDIIVITVTNKNRDFYPLDSKVQRIALDLDADSCSLFDALKYNYQRIKALRNVLQKEQVDVALGMMTTANILLAFASKGLGIPVIGSEHSHPPMLPLSRVWEWLRKYSYSQPDAVTALTQSSATWLKAETNSRYVPVIPNAVCYPMVTHPPLISPDILKIQPFNLIAVGRLSEEKGFDRLLLVFSVLALNFPLWHLTIIGEGSCRGDLEKKCLDLNLQNRVSLPGRVGNIAEWYEAADLYVMSSLFEGFPNTLVEALAYGLPVVSVDCDTGPRDIIRHQVDGLLVPQDNHEALLNSLSTLMLNEDLRQKYAKNAVEIRSRLAMTNVVNLWEALFVKVLTR